LYTEKESYKLNRILNSHRIKRLFISETDEIAKQMHSSMDTDSSLLSIAKLAETRIKQAAVEIVGKRKTVRKIDYRVITDQPNIRAARRALTESKRRQTQVKLSDLTPDSHFKLQQAEDKTKRLRNQYYRDIRTDRTKRILRDNVKLMGMSDSDKSKFIHSRIKGSTEVKAGANTKATYATMSFEGRRAVANEPEQIRLLLNSYTHYVSMDTENKEDNTEIDRKTKRGVAKFTKGTLKHDEFDTTFKTQIDDRLTHIRQELKEDISSPVDRSHKLNKAFTKKELQAALKRLKPKLWKACGSDGVHNWMVYLAGDAFHEALLRLFNSCWSKGAYPENWFQTMISYIYKGKGPLHEFTSYRPIALTSTLVNLLKSMMLARIAPVIMSQIHESQGGFRSGSGSKEQLWALIEFLEEGLQSETPTLFCTTDVHKAFDQVYRNGTLYLLYCHGIRGRMLHMLDLWINNNLATQLWKGHVASEIHLDANGLRQGCVLSPILYLLIINSLVAEAPKNPMPDWDDNFIHTAFTQGVQTLRHRTDLGEWLVYLFVDDTAFAVAILTPQMNCWEDITISLENGELE
jgi:hypothetical protein